MLRETWASTVPADRHCGGAHLTEEQTEVLQVRCMCSEDVCCCSGLRARLFCSLLLSLSFSLSLFLSFSLSLSLSHSYSYSYSYSYSFFWTRYEGPQTGPRQDTTALPWEAPVTEYASVTTEQDRRPTQKEASHRNEVTTCGDLAHVDVELPVEARPRVQPPYILCTHTRRMRHILGCGCILATFIACVVLDARGEPAAFWACHLTHAISASTTLPTNCVGGPSTVINTV